MNIILKKLNIAATENRRKISTVRIADYFIILESYYLPQRHHSRFLSLDRETLQTDDMMERQEEIEKIYNLDHRCPILLWSGFWLSPADVYRLAGDIDVRRLNGSYHGVKVLEFPHVRARRLSREKVTGAFVIMAE